MNCGIRRMPSVCFERNCQVTTVRFKNWVCYFCSSMLTSWPTWWDSTSTESHRCCCLTASSSCRHSPLRWPACLCSPLMWQLMICPLVTWIHLLCTGIQPQAGRLQVPSFWEREREGCLCLCLLLSYLLQCRDDISCIWCSSSFLLVF